MFHVSEREALHLEEGAQLTWKVSGGKVAVPTERPAFWRWEAFIVPGDLMEDVNNAREFQGRH